MKIKIIKQSNFLPPVGEELIMNADGNYNDKPGFCYQGTMINLAIEQGLAEVVEEPWQAWERRKGEMYYRIVIRNDGEIAIINDIDEMYQDENQYLNGNYYPTRELAEECAERIKKVIREFHKEHKNESGH